MELSLRLKRSDENISSDVLQEDPPSQQPPSYHSLPVPPWNAYALGYQANTPTNEDDYQIAEKKENCNSNKGIATQLAPEEFSLDDVRHLQKLIRELHAENIQKTLSYIQLEQDYYCLKDEITDLKRLKVRQKEDFQGQTPASRNKKSDEAGKEELLKESDKLKKTSEVLELEKIRSRGSSNIAEQRLENFHAIINNNNAVLAENTKLLDAMVQKVQILESELAVWKERSKEFEELHKEKSSMNAGKQADVDVPQRPSIVKNRHLDMSLTLDEERSPRRDRQNVGQSHTFIYNLAPKTNSCFSCLKAVLCRCPKVPIQAHARKTD